MSQSLRKLTLNEVNWYKPGHAIKFKLNDGQTCKAGDYKCWNSHIFDPAKKITRIECAINKINDRFECIYRGDRFVSIDCCINIKLIY